MPPTKRRRRINIVLKVATGGLRGPVVKNLTASQAAKYSESMKTGPNGLHLPPRRQNNAVDDIRYPQDQEDKNQNPMQSSATSQSIVKAATIEPFARTSYYRKFNRCHGYRHRYQRRSFYIRRPTVN
ncbi:Protein of unknown function [Pyronema omphalodes CBS 100304]|uniref:Uncharacterized protein n=1 Tax=Pyronema omphalodes (strain CBS 100304) TaxID=1076935 RepID=U4LWA2_PYROM|nr:Protein of unknown function [Pyronema omphalodes CBS 100304]